MIVLIAPLAMMDVGLSPIVSPHHARAIHLEPTAQPVRHRCLTFRTAAHEMLNGVRVNLLKHGVAPQKRTVHTSYEDEPSDYVRSAILYSWRHLTAVEKKTCKRAWGGHNAINRPIGTTDSIAMPKIGFRGSAVNSRRSVSGQIKPNGAQTELGQAPGMDFQAAAFGVYSVLIGMDISITHPSSSKKYNIFKVMGW